MGLISSITKALNSFSKSASDKVSSYSSKSKSSSNSSSSNSNSNSNTIYDNPLDRVSKTYVDRDGVERYEGTNNRVGGNVPGSIKSGGYNFYGGPVDPNSNLGSGYASANYSPGPNNLYNYSVNAGGRYDMNMDYASLIQNEQNPTMRNQYIAERNNKIEAMKANGTWKDSYAGDESMYQPNYDLYDRNVNGYVGPNSTLDKYNQNYIDVYGTFNNPTGVMYAQDQQAFQQQQAYQRKMQKEAIANNNLTSPTASIFPTSNKNGTGDASGDYYKSDLDGVNYSQRKLISDNSIGQGGTGAHIKNTSGGAISRYLASDAFKTSKFNQ